MRFFERYPLISYNNKQSRNLMMKVAIVKEVFAKYDTYYPYIIKQDERADQLADRYYGDPYYSWIIYMANDIVDPYYQWPMTDRELNDYIEKKYNMPLNQTRNLILHYTHDSVKNNDPEKKTWTMTPETFAMKANNQLVTYDPNYLVGWNNPVYAYDWELEQNDAKRSIKLLGRQYLSQIERELTDTLNKAS